MRITERTGLIYTALFLTVSVGVITQNADALMATFRGETSVQAVDDIFTVQAGRDQRLFILKNDVDSRKVTASAIQLLGQPVCGKISQTGGSFTYSGSAACTGHQSFSYCLNTGLGCEPASVALRLVKMRDPIDSVANGPAVELNGLETQISYNSGGLEITNVHLGREAASETTVKSIAGSKLARVAVDASQAINRPGAMVRVAEVDGTFDMAPMPAAGKSKIDTTTMVEVAATTDTQTDALPVGNIASVMLPVDSGQVAILPSGYSQKLTARMVKIDLGFDTPFIANGIDQSPFGTSCDVVLSGRAVGAGMVELDLKASCLPNSRVEIQHGKLKMTLRSDHIGNLNVEVPAFETNAHFMLTLGDGSKLKAAFQVPELAHIDRVAIQWRGDFDANLHALEFGASKGSQGHVWQENPGNAEQSARMGGGWSMQFGDPELEGAYRVQVYSLPIGRKTKSGIVEFNVAVRPSAMGCDKNAVIQSHHSRGGRLIGSTGMVFKLAACGETSQGVVEQTLLKNTVRDLIIAAR